MTPGSDIGSQLVASRVASGVTQSELGRRVGVKQPQIARWEADAYRTASLSRVEGIARALGLFLTAEGASFAAESPTTYVPSEPSAPSPETGQRALARLGVSPETIAAFCRLHGIRELRLFGSSVRRDFSATSDVDVLVTWSGPAPRIEALLDIQTELTGIFRRPADVVDSRSVERDENYIRRDRILREACSVYVA